MRHTRKRRICRQVSEQFPKKVRQKSGKRNDYSPIPFPIVLCLLLPMLHFLPCSCSEMSDQRVDSRPPVGSVWTVSAPRATSLSRATSIRWPARWRSHPRRFRRNHPQQLGAPAPERHEVVTRRRQHQRPLRLGLLSRRLRGSQLRRERLSLCFGLVRPITREIHARPALPLRSAHFTRVEQCDAHRKSSRCAGRTFCGATGKSEYRSDGRRQRTVRPRRRPQKAMYRCIRYWRSI